MYNDKKCEEQKFMKKGQFEGASWQPHQKGRLG